jgi:hypothetical protein
MTGAAHVPAAKKRSRSEAKANGKGAAKPAAAPSMDLDLAVPGLDTVVTRYTNYPPGGAVELSGPPAADILLPAGSTEPGMGLSLQQGCREEVAARPASPQAQGAPGAVRTPPSFRQGFLDFLLRSAPRRRV